MKKFYLLILVLLSISPSAFAQYSGSFMVNGDSDKFYPVVFDDQSWHSNKATVLEIGRSLVHQDASWRGSIIARFSYHVTNWGNGSNFIDVDLHQYSPFTGAMIAGWTDMTSGNNTTAIIVWLKGGGNTYNFTSPTSMTPAVYDNNSQPYQEPNGPLRTYKTAVDVYVNSNGINNGGTAYYSGNTNNFFAGNVGIGTPFCDAKLTVNGNLHAKEIKVDTSIPVPDYVFENNYHLPSLDDVAKYISTHKHLPEIPSADVLSKDGLNLSEMNLKLLKKVEELTLYLIEQQNVINLQNRRIWKLERTSSYKYKR